MEYQLDAQNKKIGRVASEAAKILMGKNRTDFARNIFPNIKVKIINASLADVTNKKKLNTEYKTYSGYPGGLKTKTMKKVIEIKGFREVFRKAVKGMLPSNKLRVQMIKNLTVVE